MNLYDNFSLIYKNKYLEYSKKMSEIFPLLIKNYTNEYDSILDIACGEGTFCRELTKKGFNIEGIDLSKKQIENAIQKTINENLDINYINDNIINYKKESSYNVITCWFDSLNYIINWEDLKKVFNNTFLNLKNQGVFIFDMNSIQGLIKIWNDIPYYIAEDNEGIFEVHESDYDYENNLAFMRIIFFLKNNNNTWNRYEEEHIERGYKKAEINNLLTSAGFRTIFFYSSLNPLIPDIEESNRFYVVAIK